jgi:hypothetical protein
MSLWGGGSGGVLGCLNYPLPLLFLYPTYNGIFGDNFGFFCPKNDIFSENV